MEFRPHSYQQYCIKRVVNDPAVGLFLDMGLGKTVITLTAINELKYHRFAVRKALVIAPKKVAEATWSKEAGKWDHLENLRVVTVLGSRQQRLRALDTAADVYVINRENVQWIVELYRNAWPFDMVVIDELSSFKSHKAKRFKALTWVRKSIKRIVGLTGTPAPNGLLDLWAEVYLLDEGARLGKRITQYRERYFDPGQRSREMVYSYVPKPGADKAIHKAISDICISMSADDYLQLPECVMDIRPVALTPKAVKEYVEFEKNLLVEVDGETLDAGSAAVLSGKLLQMANGAVYNDRKETVEVHGCKLEAFMETIEALNGANALVFYNFKHDLVRLRKVLEKTELAVRELKTPQDEEDWNAGKIDILLAHPASAAYGLNLQDGGNHIIWFGLSWSLELYQQANKRLHRQGQKKTVFIHHLVTEGTRDEDVMAALEAKGDTQKSLMDSLKARIAKVQKG